MFSDHIYIQWSSVQTNEWTFHGISIAPPLANWFVSMLETGLKSEIEPKMYTRYIDNIFTILFNEKTTNEFNKKLKYLDQDFMFTIHQINLPFLT